MIEKFFTTEQVANILQVHPFTILKFIKQGKLPGIKLGRVYRIKESDVKAFLEERMTTKKPKQTIQEARPKSAPSPETTFQVPDSSISDNQGDDADGYYTITK